MHAPAPAFAPYTRSGTFAGRLLGGLTLAWTVGLLYIVCAGVVPLLLLPKFEEIFAEFGVALPAFTRWLISTSRWYGGQNLGQSLPGFVVLAPLHLVALLVIVGCGLLCANRGGRLRWAARLALLLFGACLLAFLASCIVGVLFPLTAMIQSLQGSSV